MAELQIVCLGELQVMLDGIELTLFQADKNRALLPYLAIEAHVHQRAELAQFLWPGYRDESARNSLRQALHQLRQLLAVGEQENTPWLLLTRQTVQINPHAPIRIDILTFRYLLNQVTTHTHADLHTCSFCLDRLREAVSLYRNDFLAGFVLEDSMPFEKWRHFLQEQLHHQVIEALTHLAVAAEVAGDIEQAFATARRLLTLEPLHGETHRQVMRLLATQGQLADALAHYQQYQQVLGKEGRAESDPETTALYEQIRNGKWGKTSKRPGDTEQGVTREETKDTEHTVATLPAAPSLDIPSPAVPAPSALPALRDWTEMPAIDFFVERQTEVAQLTNWLMPQRTPPVPSAPATSITIKESTPAQLISILGMGGIGKTTLAAVVTKTVAPHFAVVIWRSLLNAPPLSQLLRNWLQILSRQTLITLPESLDEQLRLLLTYLQRERCLLVLDNVETIFATDPSAHPLSSKGHGDPSGREAASGEHLPSGASRAGVMQPGYEGYDQLFQRLATSDHQSCLLLTSREQPYALVRLGRQAQTATGRVRLLPLSGLDQQAGHLLLESYGVQASEAAAANLVANYSGNPLALQIVAATIVDFFGGDVTAFQQEEGQIFDGIRLVLDQQFARLSTLERDILIWLAIEREAITVATLRSNFAQPIAAPPLLEALQALQNRSLLEKREGGFTLQNVIIEYTTEYLVGQVYQEILDFRFWILDSSADESAAKIQNPKSKIQNLFLNRFALLKAQTKEYVRQSQGRLIVQPLAERLVNRLGKAQVLASIPPLLNALRAAGSPTGYSGGNLLNLLVHLGANLTDYDFSLLSVWQADLRGARFAGLDLSQADLTNSAFTFAFDLRAVKLCADRELWVAGSVAGELCLWQASGGQLHAALRLPSPGAFPLAFSPAAAGRPRFLAGGGLDHTVWLLSIDTGRYLYTLHGHHDKVWSLAFSADERLLASGSLDHTIGVWDVASGQRLHTLQGHSGGLRAVVFSPDGALLASSSSDETIRVWDTHTGQLIHVLQEHPGEVYCLAISPDGALLASGGRDCVIHLWEIHSGRHLGALLGHTHSINTLLFQPDAVAYLLASASADHTVRLWDVAAGQVVHTLVDHAFDVLPLSFSPTGDLLVSGSADQTLKLWETASGRLLDSIQGYPIVINAVSFSPDGTLLASGGANGLVLLWGVADPGQAAAVLECATAPYSQVIQRLYHTGPIYTLAFSPPSVPGPRLLACAGADCHIYLYAVGNSCPIRVLRGHTAPVNELAFSPDGQWIASASSDRTIRLWSVALVKQQAVETHGRVLVGHEDEVATLAFTPDGQTLISGSMDYTIRLWAVTSGQALGVLRGHSAGVTRVVVGSPPGADGQQIASNSFDFTLRLWDAHSGQSLQVRSGNGMGNRTVAFSPDGVLLAYVVEAVVVEIWNNRQQQVLHRLRGHTSSIKTLAFSPVAPLLASSGWDGLICLWDLATGDCLHTLHPEGPYAGMQITGVTGISEAQKAALRALGAVEG